MEENVTTSQEMKFCVECGKKILKKAVICPYCGCQVDTPKAEAVAPQVIINNSNQNQNTNNNVAMGIPYGARLRRKWVSFFLCLFLGYFGAHKFYEGKYGAGLLYALTGGLLGFGWFFSLITLLGKPDPYYVF